MAARSVPRGVPAVVAVVVAAALAVAVAQARPGDDRTAGCVRGPAVEAVAALLAVRDAGVVARAGAVPGVTGPAAALQARLAALPMSAWTSGPASGTRADPGDADRVTAQVAVTYRLAGDVRGTTRDRTVAVVRRDGCWTLDGDVPAPGAVPDLWDLGDVRVVERPRVVVLASAALGEASAVRLADDASAAAGAVEEVWAPGPPAATVLLAPRTDAEAARVAGTPDTALTGLAAVTYGPPSPNAAGPSEFGDSRVLAVPAGLAALTAQGRRFVLAHELTHVATNATARAAVPPWLQECFADAVGWAAVGLTGAEVERLVGADLRAAGVRAQALPELPARADFDPRGGGTDRAYALADAACLALVDGAHLARLAAVYAVAADRGPDAALAAAGSDAARFAQAWHRRVRDLVATDRQTAGSR